MLRTLKKKALARPIAHNMDGYRSLMREVSLPFLVLISLALPAFGQVVPGEINVHWYEGASDCARDIQPPIQVHRYNATTFVLRENLCHTFEAPFIYLLEGSTKALLIDTGDIADGAKVPLRTTVMDLLPVRRGARLPLLVVHTHRHLDHRAGDPQFADCPDVELVGPGLNSIRSYYGFTDWPNGSARVDLGDRIVDVLPTPGHSDTELSFYDRQTALFFSGDFLLPGRLLIDDVAAYRASAQRVARFVHDRPITFVLGGHIEEDRDGHLFPWQSSFHPNERVLQLTKEDLLHLPFALEQFNGVYTRTDGVVMINSIRILKIVIALLVITAAGSIWLIRTYRKRRAHFQAVRQA